MSTQAQIYPTTTHEVTNQSGPLVGVNVFACDRILNEAVRREGAGWVAARASALGAAAGESEWQEHAYLANKHAPVLKSHDRFGHRIDAVEFHPSYHTLMGLAFGSGVHSLAWTANRRARIPRVPRFLTCGTRSRTAWAARPAWPIRQFQAFAV
jgi:putative acyl-CoA dehydrogenase